MRVKQRGKSQGRGKVYENGKAHSKKKSVRAGKPAEAREQERLRARKIESKCTRQEKDMKEQKHVAGRHAGEKPQVRREAHMREQVSMCARKRSMHDSERKHVVAYSQEKESKCTEAVKHVRDGKPM